MGGPLICDSFTCDCFTCDSLLCSGHLSDGAEDLVEDRDAAVACECGRDSLICATFGRDSLIYSAVTLIYSGRML
jgi:hypothetical protein